MWRKNIFLSAIFSVFLFFFAFSASAGSITDITMDGDLDDWENVPYLINIDYNSPTLAAATAKGTTYYWNNDEDAWQTGEIDGACMYNTAWSLKLLQFKMANNTKNIYFYWMRRTDWMNYFWEYEEGNTIDEQSFTADPVSITSDVVQSEPPCMGESIYNPAKFDHDMVFSFDTDLDGDYDYYLVLNIVAPKGSAGSGYSYNIDSYIYQDNGNNKYDGRDTETLVEELGNDYKQYPGSCLDGVCQEGRIKKSKFFDDLGLKWNDAVQVRYEAYSDRYWKTASNLYSFNRHNNLKLKLNTPKNKKKINKKKVRVKGTVKKGSKIRIFVNGEKKKSFTTSKKTFSKKVRVKQGWNYVVVKAKKGSNKVTRAKKVKRT